MPHRRHHDLGRRADAAKSSPGTQIVEPTSGNTGIALAFVCAARGYPLTLTMPETMSRRTADDAQGFRRRADSHARAPTGMKGAIGKAEELAAADPNFFMPQQFKNPANPAIHFKTTGPEIWHDTDGKVDILVSGVGTGGTITGVVATSSKKRTTRCTFVAVEPVASPVISGGKPGTAQNPGSRRGLHSRHSRHDPDRFEVVTVTDEESFEIASRLRRRKGYHHAASAAARPWRPH